MTFTLPPLLDSVVGGGTPERGCLRVLMDPMPQSPGKGLVLPNLTIDQIATHSIGHSQTACRGQLTCSRCASVGHTSSDCNMEQKCVDCSQPHSTDSKLCPKWKIEKAIQTIKTDRNISYVEALKFLTPQPSQTYAQVANP
ncbi:hypothetical protein TNCV_1079821 [Trichonephila clavipes]|nr:hypothetical protein TNCV_1079821 [Trichonephila clavipes]